MFGVGDIRLEQLCAVCPEAYDAFVGDRQVGYLRLRHGSFRVDVPDAGGETIYTAEPVGDGFFMPFEREGFLQAAKEALVAHELAGFSA